MRTASRLSMGFVSDALTDSSSAKMGSASRLILTAKTTISQASAFSAISGIILTKSMENSSVDSRNSAATTSIEDVCHVGHLSNTIPRNNHVKLMVVRPIS